MNTKEAMDAVVLTVADKNEILMNKMGKLLYVFAALLIVLGCLLGGGFIAVVVGILGVLIFSLGFSLTTKNRTEYQIRQQKMELEAKIKLAGQQALAGQKVDTGETSIEKNIRRQEETKEIVKGAVVGGIVGGDVGAVVGATIAKNKIDKEKKNK